MDNSKRDIHLVGSIPLKDADRVFRTVGKLLGQRAPRIPDGETNRPWLGWLEPVFRDHPDFVSAEKHRRVQGGEELQRYRLRDGVRARDVKFSNLRHAEIARISYAAFRRAKESGVVSNNARFLLTFATPVAVLDRYVTPDQQSSVESGYEAALLEQLSEIFADIPHDQISVQWDVAREIISAEFGEPTSWGGTRNEIMLAHCERLVRLGEAIPASVELLYHLCYGDFAHKHAVEPPTTALLVEYANRIAAGLRRPVALFHLPVPRNRDDDAYFAPLDGLALPKATQICLGLIHLSDGVEGARRRMKAAERHISEYAIATECGFARRPLETINALLQLHATIAAEL